MKHPLEHERGKLNPVATSPTGIVVEKMGVAENVGSRHTQYTVNTMFSGVRFATSVKVIDCR
jgi:hypothetical protein